MEPFGRGSDKGSHHDDIKCLRECDHNFDIVEDNDCLGSLHLEHRHKGFRNSLSIQLQNLVAELPV